MTKLLNLPGVIVEDIQEAENILFLSVRAASSIAKCPRCGQTSHRLHQNKKYLVKDLPIGNREVILKVNRRRFKCENCKKPFSETLYFVRTKKNFTHRLAEKITAQVISSSINNVAKTNNLTEEEVRSMMRDAVKKMKPINVENLVRLGIDEISLVKGQGKYVVVFVDLDSHKLLGMAPKRTQVEIEKVMNRWGRKVLRQIEEVSIDMTGNYKSLVKKLCPNAEITVDRFHVMKQVQMELNQARIEEKKKAALLKGKKKSLLINNLKKSKYVLLKAEKDLSEQQKEKLEQVKKASPILATMHDLKEKFRFLFENSQNLGEGTLNLIDWLKKAEPYYKRSIKTIKRWFGEIVGYFEKGTTNGIVEGINNKLKLLKRSGYGFKNFNNFETRALLLWHYPQTLAH